MSALAWDEDPPGTLAHVHTVFRRWLGDEYDLAALDIVLAAAAVEKLGGDPVWLLVISGSGNAKTETVGSLVGSGAYITSTITSEGALLSATSGKEKAKDAHGGLLRKVGGRGVIVIKDFTSIISMNRDLRTTVLGALREVYDGRWERNVGTDGGRTLTWEGRIVLIGATTTAYDSAHAVVSAMGDRFALVRMDSTAGRLTAGRQALANVNHEAQMRSDLSGSVAELMRAIMPERAEIDDDVMDVLLQAADLVTLSRTAVETDFRGEPLEAHAPEMPTRYAKQLGQIVRGSLAIGMTKEQAIRAALRVARDSVPPFRLACLEYVLANPGSSSRSVAKGIGKPGTSTDRTLQALNAIGLIEKEDAPGHAWSWHLTDLTDPSAYDLIKFPGNVSTGGYREGKEGPAVHSTSDIPGEPVLTGPWS